MIKAISFSLQPSEWVLWNALSFLRPTVLGKNLRGKLKAFAGLLRGPNHRPCTCTYRVKRKQDGENNAEKLRRSTLANQITIEKESAEKRMSPRGGGLFERRACGRLCEPDGMLFLEYWAAQPETDRKKREELGRKPLLLLLDRREEHEA